MTLFNSWIEDQNDQNYTGTPMQCVNALPVHKFQSKKRLSHIYDVIFTWGVDPLADPRDSCHKEDFAGYDVYLHLRCRSIGGSGRFIGGTRLHMPSLGAQNEVLKL